MIQMFQLCCRSVFTQTSYSDSVTCKLWCKDGGFYLTSCPSLPEPTVAGRHAPAFDLLSVQVIFSGDNNSVCAGAAKCPQEGLAQVLNHHNKTRGSGLKY